MLDIKVILFFVLFFSAFIIFLFFELRNKNIIGRDSKEQVKEKSTPIQENSNTIKKVFSYNSDVDKNAYMNWRTNNHEPIQNMNVLADGYFQSAILLAKNCLSDDWDKKADVLIFPMLFSVNHGIELYEKSICWSLNILLDCNDTFKKSHNIREIWYIVKAKIKKFDFDVGREEDEFNKMIVGLESYLDELFETIKKDDNVNDAYRNIDFSRYPINNRNEYHFYLNRYDNVVVDLENFIVVFKDIYKCLRSLAEAYYELVEEQWTE